MPATWRSGIYVYDIIIQNYLIYYIINICIIYLYMCIIDIYVMYYKHIIICIEYGDLDLQTNHMTHGLGILWKYHGDTMLI